MPDQTPKAFLGCVPHAPFMMLQDPQLNQPFWDAYETQAKALRAFDPELVFVFGADHYSGQHMRLMPSFAIGQAAEAIADDGGSRVYQRARRASPHLPPLPNARRSDR